MRVKDLKLRNVGIGNVPDISASLNTPVKASRSVKCNMGKELVQIQGVVSDRIPPASSSGSLRLLLQDATTIEKSKEV
jgi:hypothetical protein